MKYSEEDIERMFSEILEKISSGSSLISILRYNRDMPSTETFYKWLSSSEERSKRYARACSDRADLMADDMLNIADERNGDVSFDEDGKPYFNGEMVQRARLRVDTRKWLLAKLAPKKYGDKLELTGDPENPMQSKIVVEVKRSPIEPAGSESDVEL